MSLDELLAPDLNAGFRAGGVTERLPSREKVKWKPIEPVADEFDAIIKLKGKGYKCLGVLGDAVHRTKSGSHTPWSTDSYDGVQCKRGWVYAIDITAPNMKGLEAWLLGQLRANKYQWVNYLNINGHQWSRSNGFKKQGSSRDHHLHLAGRPGFEQTNGSSIMLDWEKSRPRPRALSVGDQGEDVVEVFEELRDLGYFPGNSELQQMVPDWQPPLAEAPAEPACFDDTLQEAVKAFQRTRDLPETGEVDDEVRAQLAEPRCGFPDPAPSRELAEYVVEGGRWNKSKVTYRFDNYADHEGRLTDAEINAAVRAAFQEWQRYILLEFVEVKPGAEADMRIGFYAGDHGDGSIFRGSGGVLAHCFFPPKNGPAHPLAGDCHFDASERWTVDPTVDFDLQTVALHEIGHGLGLAHSSDPSSVMFATYARGRRKLTRDDINGIQSIYKPRA